MATKSIITRIKNKVDSINMWQGTTGLLNGEIAIVRVPTGETYINPVTGKSEPVVELLMKVGAEDSNKQPIPFDNLPWLSAKASDVYSHPQDLMFQISHLTYSVYFLRHYLPP